MSDSDSIISENRWPLSPSEERDLILSRLCDRDQLTEIGESFGLNWFEENDVQYSNTEEARKVLIEAIQDPKQLEEALNVVDPDPYRFNWFYGYHYVVEVDNRTTVTAGPAQTQWENIHKEVLELVAGNEKLSAFIRGIIEGEGSGESLRVDFNEAEARGNLHIDDERLSANRIATEPKLISGIDTRKGSSSGRSYRIAREVIPVISTALDRQAEIESGPVETPEQDVPDEIDRRIPKFQEILDEIEVTSEEINRFESILEDHDALDYWKDFVAPSVMFRPRAKKAVLCMLASLEDKDRSKGRVSAIMYGPPGTGKTAFKNFLVDEFGAFSIDGARVSKADLTYNKSTDEDGLLVRANKGLAVIEEADEMDDDALGAALTALGESGQLEIRNMRLPAEVRGILIGNYRSRQEIVEQHSEAVFDRFEFVLYFNPLDDEQRDEAIDWHIDHFRQPKDPQNIEELKRFIAWVRKFDPVVPSEVADSIKAYKRERIESFDNVREGNAVMSVAMAIARLNRRDLTLADYKQAYELVIHTENT